MKKNSQNSRPGSSAGSRRPANVSSTRNYRSAPVQTSNRSTVNGTVKRAPAKKKNNNGRVFAICAASVVVIAGIVAGCYFLKNGSPASSIGATKYSITLADGTVTEMTAEEMKKELNVATFYTGITVDGIDLSGKTKEEALELVKAQVPAAPVGVNLNLDLEGTLYPVDLSTLTLASNYEEIVNEAYNFARPAEGATDDEVLNCYKAYQGMKTAPQAYTTAYTVNTDGLSGIVHGILDPINTEKVEAQILGFDLNTLSFNVTESKEGYEIDIDKAIADTKALLDSGVYEGTIVVDAEVTIPTLSTADVTEGYGLIAETSSGTTTDNNRNHNIKITCEKIDGMVLMPGEEFSFNKEVGERTPDKGYELAGTIQSGKSELGYGGGICQLSTMIFQSVTKCDLEVIERHEHQWPSSYADTGTDAAVDWPSQDLKFKNNSEYPIAIHATYDVENRVVTVQIYGHINPDGGYIRIEGKVLSTTSATTQYVANNTMATGSREQTRAPHNGVSATSYKVYYDAAGNEIKREEYWKSYYPMIPAIIEVGVLNPDGSIAPFDSSTGTVTAPEVTPDPSESTPTESSVTDPSSGTESSTPISTDPVPSETVAPTDPAPTDPAPTETAAPTDPAPTDPAPVDPVPEA
ncbi:MAG: VanW family protein [Clostridia bacterium]|nr:VanW family protein [Clostridia bacterium]